MFTPYHNGGPGWTRTNDVSKVTGLQPATLAARLLTHITQHITFNGLEPFKLFLERKRKFELLVKTVVPREGKFLQPVADEDRTRDL